MSTVLQLNIVEARDLISADDNGFSDPFVVLRVGSATKKTKIIKKNLNPVWNETFTFNIKPNKDYDVAIEVWDWDAIGGNDFLGQIRINSDQFNDTNYEKRGWMLEGQNGEQEGNLGILFLRGRVAAPNKQGKLAPGQLSAVKSRITDALENNSDFLSLESCGLSTCPTVLADRFSGLTRLDLSYNQFVQWPDLSPLARLEELSLEGNLLVTIAPTIAFMVSLRQLMITGNQLMAIPPEIKKLTSLEKLGMANNQITTICPEIGQCKKLEDLDLSGNPITKLPVEIGGLRSCQTLDLNGCELDFLPEEFTLMTRMIELNLSNNHLEKIPMGIGRMTRLTRLTLMQNRLCELPVSIGRCIGLSEFGSGIQIADNPIINETMLMKYKMGPDHLFDYLEKRLELYEDETGPLVLPDVSLPDGFAVAADKPKTAKANQFNMNVMPAAPRGSVLNFKPPPIAQMPATGVDAELTTKMVMLKNWGVSLIRGEAKPKLKRVSNSLSRTSQVQDVMYMAQFAKNLKPEIEKAKQFMPLVPTNPHREVPQDADRLTILKLVTSVILDDVIYMVDVFYDELQKTQDIRIVLGIVAFLKVIKTELTSLSGVMSEGS